MINKPISDIKMFLKSENLLKDEPIESLRQQQPRSIMAHEYFVAAIFSPIFNEAKDRLKMMLRHKYCCSDGMRPDEIGMFIRNLKQGSGYFENDLSKQDR